MVGEIGEGEVRIVLSDAFAQALLGSVGAEKLEHEKEYLKF